MPAAGSTDTMDSGDHMWTFAVSKRLVWLWSAARWWGRMSTSTCRCHAVAAEARCCWSPGAQPPTSPPLCLDATACDPQSQYAIAGLAISAGAVIYTWPFHSESAGTSRSAAACRFQAAPAR